MVRVEVVSRSLPRAHFLFGPVGLVLYLLLRLALRNPERKLHLMKLFMESRLFI